jgi:hypothetical protein
MALKLYSGRASALKVYASDWKLVAKALYQTDKEQSFQLKKRFKEISRPIQVSVKREIKDGTKGQAPMSGMLHGGRTGWSRDYGNVGSAVSGAKRQLFDSVLVESFNKPKRGQTGIARLRVRSAATVLGDLANTFSGRTYTRLYKIREFGGEEISRNHIVTVKSVSQFLQNLKPISKASKRKKSRNVYPGFDKAYPEAKVEAEIAIRAAISVIESKIDRTAR